MQSYSQLLTLFQSQRLKLFSFPSGTRTLGSFRSHVRVCVCAFRLTRCLAPLFACRHAKALDVAGRLTTDKMLAASRTLAGHHKAIALEERLTLLQENHMQQEQEAAAAKAAQGAAQDAAQEAEEADDFTHEASCHLVCHVNVAAVCMLILDRSLPTCHRRSCTGS